MTETVRSAQDDAAFFAQRGFGQRIGFGERPALAIIDMLKAFTDEKAMLGANLDKELAAIVPLLAAAHERGMPVIFSTVRYDDADLKDAGIWALKQKGVTTLRGEDKGWEVDPRLDLRKTDTLLLKKYASCFFGIDLVPRLLAHRVDTLVITGCTTSGCVRATAVDAWQNGSARWWCARLLATARLPPMRKACSTSTRNMPMSCRSHTRSPTSSASATIRPHGGSADDDLRKSSSKSTRPHGQQAL
jgi:maleamate amidohydrolase